MFRRRSRGGEADDLDESPADSAGAAADDQRLESDDISPLAGPWDIDDAPDDELTRLDLGGLQIPAVSDVEIRLETHPEGGVVAVLLVSGTSMLQIGAFAAPRRAGIWTDVRADLLESLRADGHQGEEREGPFGPELVAVVPAEQGTQPARFVGVDGPRWFLRGVFTGPSATDPVQAEVLERVLREVVVARGGDALPVRDPLPLTLPPDLVDAEDSGDDPPSGTQAPREPRRGPEITEIG